MPDEPLPDTPPPLRAPVIVEYVDEKGARIYTTGYLELVVEEEETLPALPSQRRPVLKADGKIVSYEAYCAEIGVDLTEEQSGEPVPQEQTAREPA